MLSVVTHKSFQKVAVMQLECNLTLHEEEHAQAHLADLLSYTSRHGSPSSD